jgi:glutathione S-transferase
VLAHYNIPHEVVNINLKDKPDWFLARTPVGLVPVLQQDDKLVHESTICCEYLDDVYGEKKLFPQDPYARAQMKFLMANFNKVTDKFNAHFRAKTAEEKQDQLNDMHKALMLYEEALTGKYFGGDKPSMLDMHIWVYFERMPLLQKIIDLETLPAAKFPKLAAWVKTMHDLPAVKETKFSDEEHWKFYVSYASGGMPDYDMGL